MTKTVALLMPSLNEENSVAYTLDSIFKSSRLPDEIIVADGGSKDRTLSIVEQYKNKGVDLKVVNNPEVFAGAGRNHAFEVCTSSVIMLMDFGNTVESDWIEKMVAPFEQEAEIDFVSGAFIPHANTGFEHCVACILYHNNSLLDKIPLEKLMKQMPKDHSPGALSLAVSRKMWEKLEGMPSWLRASEDKLFGRKMMTFNPDYRLLPDARISHHMRSNSWQVFCQMRTYSRGNGRTKLMFKHDIKLMLMYVTLPFLILTAFWQPLIIILLTVGAALYAWKSGVRKLIKVDGKVQKKRFMLYASQIVFARDLGMITGLILGLVDWLCKPEFKRKFLHYVRGTKLVDRQSITD